MPQQVLTKQLVTELKTIRKDLNYIKQHMVDVDMLLTRKEEARLEDSLKAYREGKAIKLESFEKERHK